MEIVLFAENINGSIGEVNRQVAKPYLNQEEVDKGYVFNQNDIPVPEQQVGKHTQLMLNIETLELFYEYRDRTLTAEEELTKLKAENAQLGQELVDFKLGYLSVPCQYHQDYSSWVETKLEEEKANGTV